MQQQSVQCGGAVMQIAHVHSFSLRELNLSAVVPVARARYILNSVCDTVRERERLHSRDAYQCGPSGQ